MVTPEQWEQIEQELQGFYGKVTLKLQGRELTLVKSMYSENRLAIVVYIDGKYKPAWGLPEHKERDPFVDQIWRKRTKSLYPPKKKAKIIKVLGKRRASKEFELDKKYIGYVPVFNTAKSLINQYKKIKDLEFISIGITTGETA